MSEDIEFSLVEVVLSHLGEHDKQHSLIISLAENLASDDHPSINRLPEAKLVVGYLSRATLDASRHEITQHVVCFLDRLIAQDHDVEALRRIVSLAGTNEHVQRALHRRLEYSLWRAATSAGQVTASLDLPQLSSLLKPTADDEAIHENILPVLNYFQACYRARRGHQDLQPLGDDLLALIILVASEDRLVSGRAVNVAVALIDCASVDALNEASFIDRVWPAVLANVRQEDSRSLATAGLTLWLRLLSRANLLDLVASPDYWNCLHRVFSAGSPEQQRMSLAIFRVSVSLYYQEQASSIITRAEAQRCLDQYSKFMTVFQVVVLDRYLNLIKEVVDDLITIARPDSGFPIRWVFALLSAALSPASQLSVRRVIGNWIIEHPEIFQNAGSSVLLERSFLPWATIGSPFNTSVTLDSDGWAICPYADRLIGFIRNIMEDASETIAHQNLQAILRFLCSAGRRIFSPARAAVLTGMQQALRSKTPTYTRDVLGLLHSAADIGGFQEVAMDYCAVMFGAIFDNLNVSGSEISIPDTVQKRIARVYRSSPKDSQSPDIEISGMESVTIENGHSTMKRLTEAIERSQHRCLAHGGLVPAMNLVRRALFEESEVLHAGDETLSFLFKAFHEELEVQEWPRDALMSFSNNLFNPLLAGQFKRLSKLPTLSATIFEELLSMMQGKIYIFVILATAIRRLALQHPKEAVRIGVWSFIETVARDPPETSDEFLLEAYLAQRLTAFAPSRNYRSYYGEPEDYGYACFFDILNTLPQQDAMFSESARSLFYSLLEPWPKQTVPVSGWAKWKNTVQIHVMMFLLEHLLKHCPNSEVDSILTEVLKILEIEILPRYRFLFEWITARIIYRHTDLRARVVALLPKMELSNPKMCISILKLAVMICGFPDATEQDARNLSIQLLLLSACPKVAVRHEAQWQVPQLWTLCEERHWMRVMGDEIFSAMNTSLRDTDFYKTPSATRLQEALDPVADFTLQNLLEGPYLEIQPRIRPKTHASTISVVWWHDNKTREQPTPHLIPYGNDPRRKLIIKEAAIRANKPLEPDRSAEYAGTSNAPLQLKGHVSLAEPAKIPLTLLVPGNSGNPVRPSPLVVVATLVDSHWNLGGICRAAEILGAAAVYFNTIRVLDSAAFTSTSVSAQHHIPIEPLGTAEMSGFLTKKRAEGYEVVGVEQTDTSRVLGMAGPGGARFQSDGRTVLVLGAESTGMPGEVLADVDWCVEIRQKGVTRSMNVQTAAAVVMYEYVRQRELEATKE